jgi:hypothetical protein
MAAGPRYMTSALTAQEAPLPTFSPVLRVTLSLPISGCFSGSTDFCFEEMNYVLAVRVQSHQDGLLTVTLRLLHEL